MTLHKETNKSSHVGDGSTTVFAYDYRVDFQQDMKVYLATAMQASGWTIDGLQNPSGGNVTFDTAPAAGVRVTLVREAPYTQEVQFDANDPFPAKTQEQLSDKLTMQTQQLAEGVGRAVQAPQGGDPEVDYNLPDYAAGKGLMWSETEKKLVVSDDNLNGILSGAIAARDAAQASATAASTSEGNAATSAVEAFTYRNETEVMRDQVLNFPKTENVWEAVQRYDKVQFLDLATVNINASVSPAVQIRLDQATTINLTNMGIWDRSVIIELFNNTGADHAITWTTDSASGNVRWMEGANVSGPGPGKVKVVFIWSDGDNTFASVSWEG